MSVIVAVTAPNGFPRIGKFVTTHHLNPDYVYIEDEYGRIDGGILLPTFNGPFKNGGDK